MRTNSENREEGSELELLWKILHEIRSLRHFLEKPKELKISQLFGGIAMPIKGISVGGSGTFQESGLPAGSVFPAGTTFKWTSSDTANVADTPSSDGTQDAEAVGAAAVAGGSNTLTCTATLPDGSTVTGSGTVPYLPAAVVVPTSIQIDQIA